VIVIVIVVRALGAETGTIGAGPNGTVV